ncbi:MAG: hypothetical protein IGR76_10105 [Synechococcales cyanobacterium T60_A2020_003]|nr:hypothetical protein [Synechococcales cyanobacterium T60_A2020_003]
MTSASDHPSPEKVCEELEQLVQDDQIDPVTGAAYRQDAQDVLADPEVSLPLRQAVADRLQEANHQLEKRTVGKEDSY